MNGEILYKYKNGNYNVIIYNDGTKIRYNNEEKLLPEFPESIDCKISNFCPYNCVQCHEQSSSKGKLGKILHSTFIKSLHPYTEIAIGGGAVTYHPQLIKFLKELKSYKLIPNITINQNEYYDNTPIINSIIDENLIYGLGVSFTNYDDIAWKKILDYPNAVVHLIAGFHSIDVFRYFMEKRAKILILGYKFFGRGENYGAKNTQRIIENQEDLIGILPELIERCKVVSFDNLAIEQLEVKNLLSEDEFSRFYMGDDGQYTMYVDLVEKQCAVSSTTPKDKRYPLKDFYKIFEEVKLK